MVVPDAGLITADTGTNIVKPSRAGLVRHLGVGNQRPGHTAHIRLPKGKHLLSQLWLVDAPGNEDGLPHFAHKGFFYNGVPYESAKPTGAERLGIQNAGVNGVFTRGVLIDMPRFLGVDFLQPGAAITIVDLEAWEKKTGVTVAAGDVVLIRTGRWAKIKQDGQWNFLAQAAGMHASVAQWLKDRDVAVIGCDGVSDVMPSGVEGLVNPLHELVLVGLGMPILDNLDLEAVAQAAAERGRNTFLYVGAPLRVPGGTGSPLNPLAVF
jgi:kynurenine formamidase